ncbi:methyl-accepting chemotaxis protein, partial [Rhizobium johnstonii]
DQCLGRLPLIVRCHQSYVADGDRRLEARGDEIGKLAREVAGLRDAISAKEEREADAEAKRAVSERHRLEKDADERRTL